MTARVIQKSAIPSFSEDRFCFRLRSHGLGLRSGSSARFQFHTSTMAMKVSEPTVPGGSQTLQTMFGAVRPNTKTVVCYAVHISRLFCH